MDAYLRLQQRKAEEHNAYAMSMVSYSHGRVSEEDFLKYDKEALESNIYDYIVIGSGYGGSIYAMRMAEKGYSVLLLEQGRRWSNKKADVDLSFSDLWKPNLFKWLCGNRQCISLGGICVETNVGVGGCSLGNTSHLEEHPDFKDLKPFYEKVRHNLGVTTQPSILERDAQVVAAASRAGVPFEAYRTDVGVFFGKQTGTKKEVALHSNEDRQAQKVLNDPKRNVPTPEQKSHNTRRQQIQRQSLGMTDANIGERGRAVWDDPYFGGIGMNRSPCMECGECSVGCTRNAKNSLDKNYTFMSEQRYDVNLVTGCRVDAVRYLGAIESEEDDSRYVVDGIISQMVGNEKGLTDFTVRKKFSVQLKARNVVVSCGTVETNALLLAMKNDPLGLPELPNSVGTNIYSPNMVKMHVTSLDFEEGTPDGRNFTEGVTTSAVLKTTDNNGKIEVSGVPPESSRIRYSCFRRSDDGSWGGVGNAIMKAFNNWYQSPYDMFHYSTKPAWNETTVVLKEVTPNSDPMTMRLVKKKPVLDCTIPRNVPTHSKKVADEILEQLGGGYIGQSYKEVFLNKSIVSDIVGGVDEDVINKETNEVHQYPGLYVVDGSTISQSLGAVDSTLTVAALSERAAASVPISSSGMAKERFSEFTPWTNIELKDRGFKVVPTSKTESKK
eukprot:TRINITY_DN9387_c0_g1_i3.p1 TRINITY_DN9387_c0_g1~~TRINITY_DN9387_c0_g1_i3.p1  ORF type:complete len:711 (+),score=155.64 TRINITY_DN9387_c0_g1_i3:134-2134(+)